MENNFLYTNPLSLITGDTVTRNLAEEEKYSINTDLSRPIRIFVDGRSLIYPEIYERGIGAYSEHHLRALGLLLSKFKSELLVALPSNALTKSLSPCLKTLSATPGIIIKPWFEARKFQVDLYHIIDQMTVIIGYDSPLLAAPSNIPVTTTFYDLIPLVVKDLHFDQWHPTLQLIYQERLLELKESDATILTISQTTAHDLHNLLQIPHCKLHTIMAGVRPPSESLITDDQLSKKWGISQPYFLVVGGLEKHKNFSTTYEAFIKHCQAGLPGSLVVVGSLSDPVKATYAAHSTSHIPTRVHFTGFINNSELDLLYRLATALIFPSLYEGFGFPVAEAMARGCPVIVSNLASLPEIVGDAGIILPSPNINNLAEALKFTIEQPNKLEDLRKKGKENSKKFTWDNVAKATLNKWLELINKYQTNVLSSIK